MSDLDRLLQSLWDDYAALNAQAHAIHQLLEERGEVVVNDHIAFRTFQHDKVGIPVLAAHFIKNGYEAKGEYEFRAKKLFARHYEHPDGKYPRVFISELKLGEFSAELQAAVTHLIDAIRAEDVVHPGFLHGGALWSPVSYETYHKLKEESEYAAWMAVFGFRANHFTVLFNALKSFRDMVEFNQFIKDSGYPLNDSGGEIKGSPQDMLEQSSTLAHQVEVEFADRKAVVPACYYEFARRYPMSDGQLFSGFVAQSADKIFESTDNK